MVKKADLCIYGQSPAGITAAIEAKRKGLKVVLLVNSPWLGGLTTGGLGNTDIGNKGAIGGLAREFYQRVGRHYGLKEEWRFEPSVAEKVFRNWLKEVGVKPMMAEYVKTVKKGRDGRIVSLGCESGLKVEAGCFLDASYEGDLMAKAGVSFVVGREGNKEFGEKLNGVQMEATHQFDFPVDPYRKEGMPASGLLPGIEKGKVAKIGSGDKKVQAYNFRMCLTKEARRIRFEKPKGYKAENYELLARYFRAGWRDLFWKFDVIRGGKTDTNNHGAVSTDFIGGNWKFPEAGLKEREKIFQAHVAWQKGLMWFLATDPRVPGDLQEEFNKWGLPREEFKDTGGWARQLYIRESRRMRGEYVVTEKDCRGKVKTKEGIGLGAYAMDSHNCQRVVVKGKVRNEGDVQAFGIKPYPISYRALTPLRKECGNLLVTVCVSASHIAYGSVRMEPVFMVLGQAGACAAALALKRGCAVQEVEVPELQAELLKGGQEICWKGGDAAYEPEGKLEEK